MIWFDMIWYLASNDANKIRFIWNLYINKYMYVLIDLAFNTLRPRQNGRHFAVDTFNHIFLNENVWILIKISLKFVPKGPINNIQALVQIMAWRRPGDKPLSEPMMVSLLTQLCVTRPQWVKCIQINIWIQNHKIITFARFMTITVL